MRDRDRLRPCGLRVEGGDRGARSRKDGTRCWTWARTARSPSTIRTSPRRWARRCSRARAERGIARVRQRRGRVGGGQQDPRRSAPAVCHDTYSAHQGVEHDDMNVLVLGGRSGVGVAGAGARVRRAPVHCEDATCTRRENAIERRSRETSSGPARRRHARLAVASLAALFGPVGLARLHPPQPHHERRAAAA